VCSETYGLAPEVVVSGDRFARLPYLTAHLDYMIYELLKNSMRAVVERHRKSTYTTRSRTLPPIVVSDV
jgi:[3-methyl-2-oxobutanoate dehydrogenase (acetyl-transferring)] kinase